MPIEDTSDGSRAGCCSKKICCEIFQAAACNMGPLVCGFACGWPSPAFVILTNWDEEPENSPLSRDQALTGEMFSWYSASMFGSAAIGAPAGAALARLTGIRWALLIGSCPILISWMFLSTADRGLHVLFGRLFAGFTYGLVFTVSPVYTALIASDEIRGALGSLLQLELCLGVLVVYVLGPYVPLDTIGWICMGITFLYILCFAFCKDVVITEPAAPVKKCLQRIFCPGTVDNRAFTITSILIATQQGCGINIVLMNAQDIFNAGGTSEGTISPELSTILVGLVMLIASLFCPLLVDKLGRRPLLILSFFGQALCMIVMAIYMYVFRELGEHTMGKWKPASQTAMMLYVALFSVGSGPCPWLISGEMFAGDIRPVACAVVASIAWITTATLAASWFYLRTFLGYDAAFVVFAVICIIGGICVLLLLPETKGKSFSEIQEILSSNQRFFVKGKPYTNN